MTLSFQDKIKPVASSTNLSFMDKVKPVVVNAEPEKPKKEGLRGELDTAFDARASKINEAILAGRSGEQSGLSTAFQVGGNIIGGLLDAPLTIAKNVLPTAANIADKAMSISPLYVAGKKAVTAALPPVTKAASGAYGSVVDYLSDTKLFREAAPYSGAIERNIEAFNEYLNILPAEKIPGIIKSTVTKTLGKADEILTPSQSALEGKIVDKYEKGIRPTIAGKGTATQVAGYREDVVDAAKIINQNKQALQFSDDAGNIIVGENPATIQQFSEAIQQTKSKIFNEYDELARRAGQAGVKVDLIPIADELTPVINSKALELASPGTIEYARRYQDRLNSVGSIGTKEAQEVIKIANQSLDAFYRNPTYDTASRAAIDALVVNKMRESLDNAVTSLTGESYQSLKNQYSALKTIEKDVVKAGLRESRKNTKGLIDYTDIFSGGQIVGSVLSLDPGLFATGVASRGIKEYYKLLNSPDRAIKNLFEAASKLPTPPPQVPSRKLPIRTLPSQYTDELPTINAGSTPQSTIRKEMNEASKNLPTVEEYKPRIYMNDKGIPNKQGGFISIGGKKVNVHEEDIATMKDFTDYVAGDYKPSEIEAFQLELAASRIAEKYGIKQFKSTRGLANEFGRLLDTEGMASFGALIPIAATTAVGTVAYAKIKE